MDITKAIEIIKEYGISIGSNDMLQTLDNMMHDEHKSNLERAAMNLFMYEGSKMFESVKIRLEV